MIAGLVSCFDKRPHHQQNCSDDDGFSVHEVASKAGRERDSAAAAAAGRRAEGGRDVGRVAPGTRTGRTSPSCVAVTLT